MANTPHTAFRLSEEVKEKLETLSRVSSASMTDIVSKLIAKEYENMKDTYINTAEEYGDMYPVTVADYEEMNPNGEFVERTDYIVEMVDGQPRYVATRLEVIEWA